MQIKICIKCKEGKDSSEFHIKSANKDGLNGSCKSCISAYQKSLHPLISLFKNIKQRCYNPNRVDYHRYGGRGVTLCEEWLNDKEVFIEWAESNGWERGLTIDRINNDLGYSPENCRFISQKKNTQNQERSMWWFINQDKYKSLRDAAKGEGVGIATIQNWCYGRTVNGKFYPPKPNCWSELKYAN